MSRANRSNKERFCSFIRKIGIQLKWREKVVLGKEIDKLNLDPLTKQSVYDLTGLIEAQIIKELGDYNINDKLILVRQVIVIVHNTAEQRIKYIEQMEKDKK